MFQPPRDSYPNYYHPYINRVLGKPLVEQLESQHLNYSKFFKNIPEGLHEYRYADNKWTPKDILIHLTDTERIFSYRALKIVRGEGLNLSSFDQDQFVLTASANRFNMSELIEQYTAVRHSTLSLFKSFDLDQLSESGSIDTKPISAGALGFIILGHEQHHVEVLNERYL